MIRNLTIPVAVMAALMSRVSAHAQSSPAGTVMQAQTENLIVMPANRYWVGFNQVTTTLPTDSLPKFYYDVRAMAYVSGESVTTTCRVGLSADPVNNTPLILSPVVDVLANTTVAIPLEYVGTAFAGQKLTLSMQLISGPAALNIQQWTSVTAEVVPTE